jgi:hypothetical protein
MIRITSKVKIAAGLAAGALTLGAAGAYAATANNTITVNNPTPFTLGSGTDTLSLVSLDGSTLTLPSGGFRNAGQCVSWLAQNKQVALAPEGTLGGSLKLAKNYHGKLLSAANTWCKTQATATRTAKTKPDTSTESDSEDSTDADAQQPGGPHTHGHGHAYGRSKHAA